MFMSIMSTPFTNAAAAAGAAAAASVAAVLLQNQYYNFTTANDFQFMRQHTVEWFLLDT